ncbi:MAG: hypothetical protein COX19_16325 [Desulfobacterales bacterium CG23_combo_of_CG06-09_8_20_14_all_51_8]|nr:MAG: hypothetical protein COX19_16325 [Desulfobacterales bacterium CG23_combo_of_CG06-09_8_20_14_all_51_8]
MGKIIEKLWSFLHGYIIQGDTYTVPGIPGNSIELGPEMLNFRRTRASLLHTQNKNRDAFKKDLNWVLSQDPKKERHYLSYPWSIFVQRNSQDMLDHIDDYFD